MFTTTLSKSMSMETKILMILDKGKLQAGCHCSVTVTVLSLYCIRAHTEVQYLRNIQTFSKRH